MIKVNDVVVNAENFLDRTFRVNNFSVQPYQDIFIDWLYDNESENILLYYVVNHIRENFSPKKMVLRLPYIPNARMDRVKSNTEVFTLKYFAKFINDLNFDNVIVLDPHSDVSKALINRLYVCTGELNIDEVLNSYATAMGIDPGRVVFYFPDAGAYKRYKDMGVFKGHQLIYGEKVRDWETGKIKGLKVKYDGEDLLIYKNATVIMIDDIVSYGGTLYYSALELKKLGFEHIGAYVSHTENSVLDRENGTLVKLLDSGDVTLFTTDSIYRGSHENILVLK